MYNLAPTRTYTIKHLSKCFQLAVAWGLDVFIKDDFADGTVADKACARVLDGRDVAFNGGLDGGIFKSQISVSAHCAVLQYEVVAVAQWLGLGDVAADEAEVLRVPGKIFTINHRIDDGDILGLPEGILGVQDAVPDLHVLGVLETVVAVQFDVGQLDILAVHKHIVGPVDHRILDLDVLTVPERLSAARNLDVLQFDAVHPAEGLRSVDDSVVDLAIP